MSVVSVIAAHADDESLGVGGTIAKLAAAGDAVHVLVLADGESSRRFAPGVDFQIRTARRSNQAQAAIARLAAKSVSCIGLPDQGLDTMPLLHISQYISEHIASLHPDTVFTHFPGDLNQDHRAAAHATLIATRPTPGHSVRHVYAYEVPSATGWAFGLDRSFEPNLFSRLTEQQLAAKLDALQCYTDEIPAWPHARSLRAVEARAVYWGSVIGCDAAEAFMVLRSEWS